MGMFSFVKEAGEKLFGIGKAEAAPAAADAAALSNAAGNAALATFGTGDVLRL